MDWMGDERVSGQRTFTSHCGAPTPTFTFPCCFIWFSSFYPLFLSAPLFSPYLFYFYRFLYIPPSVPPLRYQSFFPPSLPCLRPFHSCHPFFVLFLLHLSFHHSPPVNDPYYVFRFTALYSPMPMPMPSHFLPYRSYTHSLFDASSQTWWTFEFVACSVLSVDVVCSLSYSSRRRRKKK